MKILLIHNFYQQPGGEKVVVEREIQMLRDNGHDVILYTRNNDEAATMGKLALAQQSIWAKDSYHAIQKFITDEKPDLAHIHNTHMMISPSVIHACADMNLPIVQTLHNFRLLCPVATFFRDGHVCEDCLGKSVQYPAVLYGCFRDSRAQSAVIAANNAFHGWKNTWRRVNYFITPTEFARQKLIQGGFDGSRIIVKPHFLPGDLNDKPENLHRIGFDASNPYFVVVGRLSPEKGTRVLLHAWKYLQGVPLKIVGDGPLMDEAKSVLQKYPNLDIELLGHLKSQQVNHLMQNALALVFPSECYETFGNVIIESFALGTPVIAVGHGASAELVTHGVDGYHFEPGHAESLAKTVQSLWENQPLAAKMGEDARHTYENHYTADRNYQQLMAVYRQVVT